MLAHGDRCTRSVSWRRVGDDRSFVGRYESSENEMNFDEVVRGLIAGDFSRLAPLFEAPADGRPARSYAGMRAVFSRMSRKLWPKRSRARASMGPRRWWSIS